MKTESTSTSSDNSLREMSRRECLSWLSRASAVVLAGAAIDCVHAEDEGAQGFVKIANLTAVACGTAREIDKPNLILVRSEKGIACMSITCTHRRSKLDVAKDGTISCPAHSSSFDFDGKPTGGPATSPLTRYRSEISKDGDITVDVSSSVRPGDWTELPDWAKSKK